MARRLQFFRDQWYRKLGRDSCTLPFYLLAGDKPIDEKKEGRKAMPGIIKETGLELYPGWDDATWPTTEVEALRFIIRCSGMDLNCRDVESSTEPATTYSTAIDLFRTISPEQTNFLVISSQPFCLNQLLTVRRAAKEAGVEVNCDICGPAVPDSLPLAKILDTVAKQLWEECKALA